MNHQDVYSTGGGGESARGRTSQRANQPGTRGESTRGKQAKRRASQGRTSQGAKEPGGESKIISAVKIHGK